MFKNIVMQMRKGNCEKGYWGGIPVWDVFFCERHLRKGDAFV